MLQIRAGFSRDHVILQILCDPVNRAVSQFGQQVFLHRSMRTVGGSKYHRACQADIYI